MPARRRSRAARNCPRSPGRWDTPTLIRPGSTPNGPEHLEQPRLGRSRGVSGEVLIQPRSNNSRSGIGVFLRVPEHVDPVITFPVVSEDRDGLTAWLHRNERSQFFGQLLHLRLVSRSEREPDQTCVHRGTSSVRLTADSLTSRRRRRAPVGAEPEGAPLEVADTGRVLVMPQYAGPGCDPAALRGGSVTRWPTAPVGERGDDVAGRWVGQSRPSASGHPIREGECFP